MADSAGGAAAAGGRFEDLLEQLRREHESELSLLRREVATLREGPAAKLAAPPPRRAATAHGGADAKRAFTTATFSDMSHSNTMSSGGLLPISRLLTRPTATDAKICSGSSDLLELKGVWKDSNRDCTVSEFQMMTLGAQEDAMERTSSAKGEALKGRSMFSRLIVSPNSSGRLNWELLGMGFVCFDMINIPLQVFAIPVNWFSICMDWAALIFWTCDMFSAFFVGYYDKGELIMDNSRIVRHYLRTWFVIDLLVVGPDWVLTIAGLNSEAGDFSRLLRGARIIRVLRLLRIMKLQRVINKLYDIIDNEYTFIIAELIKMMVFILVLNHVIACGWFLVGGLSSSLGYASWITWSEDFLELGVGYQYTTSLHWTLTQFTPASMDVVARNITERTYSIIVLLFAMVAFSSIVGTVTSSMTVIRQMKNDKQKQFWMLRRYLKQKGVSPDLTLRMTRFLEHQVEKQEKTIQVGKVLILQHISDQLSSELHHEMYAPCLKGHALFECLSREMKGVASRICHFALKSQQLATGDTVFSLGEEASRTFIIKSGDFQYTLCNGKPLDPPLVLQEWLAEAVLWTPWRYRGRCRAVAPSELLALDGGRFAEAMTIHPKPWAFARHYGEMFIRCLNCQGPGEWSDVLRNKDFYSTAVDRSYSARDSEGLAAEEVEEEEEVQQEEMEAAEAQEGSSVSTGSKGAMPEEAPAEAAEQEAPGLDVSQVEVFEGSQDEPPPAPARRPRLQRCFTGACFPAPELFPCEASRLRRRAD